MQRNQADYRQSNVEEHSLSYDEESISEWQTRAIRPFAENLHHRNPELAEELANEYQAVTDQKHVKHPVSWLDDHPSESRHPGEYNYPEREPTLVESQILLSYRDSAHQLDSIQQEHLTATLTEAMSHRPNAVFSTQFPQQTDYANLHHPNASIPDPASYNNIMRAAREYFASLIQEAENTLSRAFRNQDDHTLTTAVDCLRNAEHNMERSSSTGYLPTYIDTVDGDQALYGAHFARAEVLANAFTQEFATTHPGEHPDPENPDFINLFKEKTKDYLLGDIHNLADHFAYNHAIDAANKSGAKSPEEMEQHYRQNRETIYQSLTGYDHAIPPKRA